MWMCPVYKTIPVTRVGYAGQPKADTHRQEQLQSLQCCSPLERAFPAVSCLHCTTLCSCSCYPEEALSPKCPFGHISTAHGPQVL